MMNEMNVDAIRKLTTESLQNAERKRLQEMEKIARKWSYLQSVIQERNSLLEKLAKANQSLRKENEKLRELLEHERGKTAQ